MKKPYLIALFVVVAGCPADVGPLLGVELTAPAGSVFTNGTVELSLNVTGGPDKVAVLRDGEEVATVAAPYDKVSLDTTTWTEGAHAVVVRATLKTSSAESAALRVNVDRTPPRVTYRWPEGAAWWADGFGVVFDERVNVAASGVLTVQSNPAAGTLSLNGQGYSAHPTPAYSAVPFSGQVALAAGALTDLAGNANEGATWSFEVTKWAKTSVAAGTSPRVAIETSGAALVAFSQADQIVVHRVAEGRSTPLPPLGSGTFASIAVDRAGRAVVVRQTATDVVAALLEVDHWVPLGATVGAGASPDVAFDFNFNPVVAWVGAGAVHVSRWNGTAWTQAAPDIMNAREPSLAMDGDTPVVAYVEGTTVKVGGTALNVRGRSAARSPKLAAGNGQLFIAWEEDDDVASSIHVAQRVNGTWTRLGRPLDVDLSRRARAPVLTVDSTGAPIVAWAEESHWGRWTLPISRWSQGAWTFLGGEEITGGAIAVAGAIALSGDAPVVAAQQSGNVAVHRFNGAGLANPFGIAARAAATSCSLGLETGAPRSSLAATSCFDVTQNPPRAAADLVPYDLNSPLWSDGALKRRWVRLPAGTTLGYAGQGAFDFPIGTMVVKEFSYVQTPGDPTTRRPVETRFLVKREDAGWEGYGYEWTPAFSDATLLDEAATKRVTWSYAGGDGGHTQIYPTRDECRTCHVRAAGDILGLQAGQLNRTHDYGGVFDDQLRTFEHLGLFGAVSAADAGRFANPHDTTEPLARRVRGYLAANCSQCHQPGGARPTRDFRWETPFEDTHLCDAGAPFGAAIVPGDSMSSLLPAKMEGVAFGNRMPPLATDVVDTDALSLVNEWINSLTECR